ncbi:hypothetical protein BDR22DRAFT_958912 [Usnea florida]
MEIIGAASSIITVIQICGTVISICYDFQRGTRNYDKDVVAITHELQSLRNILERLADILGSQDVSASVALPTLDSLKHPGGPLEICKRELKCLELKLIPATSRSRQLGRALAWPLREKDFQKTLASLARQRGLSQLALTADQATMTLALKYVASKNEGNLVALTERCKAMAVDRRNEQILQWLGPPDPSSNHHKACGTKHPETGRWLLESLKYTIWKNKRASFLWIHGIPGCGRTEPTTGVLTTLLKKLIAQRKETYIVLDALDEGGEILAVISLIDEIRGWHDQSLHILVTSRKERLIEKGLRQLITHQVCIQNVYVDADIKLLVRECLSSDPDLSRWPETIKAEIEKKLCEGSQGMFRWAVCQLDTLRKCIKPSALRKVLATLPKTLDDTYERILCAIDEAHAADAFKILQWLAFSMRPLELQELAEATAITLDDRPKFDPEDRLRHPTDILTICSSLVSISAKSTEKSFRSSFLGRSTLTSSQPELTSSYEDSAYSSSSWSDEDSSLSIDASVDQKSTLLSSVSEWISGGDDSSCTTSRHEGTPINELHHVPPALVAHDSCHHYEVRLAHDSVREYLVSQRIKTSRAAFYSIDEASTNDLLARSCLAYLLHFKQPLEDATAEYLSQYPLLRYSAQQWESHVANSGDSSSDSRMTSVLKDFFLTQNFCFPNWLILPFASVHGTYQCVQGGVDEGGHLKFGQRLFHASRLGLLEICKVLLEQGISADPPTMSENGPVKSLSTPLQIVAHRGHETLVRLLLDNGAKVNQRSIYASTLDYAVQEGRESVVRLLLERGAEVTVEEASAHYGQRRFPTLVLAARTGHLGIMKLILDSTKYSKPRQVYIEAYREANAQGHRSVADLVLEYGAEPAFSASTDDSDDSNDEYFDVEWASNLVDG